MVNKLGCVIYVRYVRPGEMSTEYASPGNVLLYTTANIFKEQENTGIMKFINRLIFCQFTFSNLRFSDCLSKTNH